MNLGMDDFNRVGMFWEGDLYFRVDVDELVVGVVYNGVLLL